jgi:hypothetical protein
VPPNGGRYAVRCNSGRDLEALITPLPPVRREKREKLPLRKKLEVKLTKATMVGF